MIEKIIQDLQAEFGEAVREVKEFRGEHTFLLDKKIIARACAFLKEKHGFTYCVDVCGADRFTEGKERFEVIYNILNLDTALRLRLKVRIDEDEPSVDTVTNVWEGANWHERETFDMYGITFTNHPDLRRMYMPEDFEYYPLRKEYPLVGIKGSIPLPTKNN